MTIRERAETAAKAVVFGNGMVSSAIIIVEEAIIAAIEEERDNCATIAEEIQIIIPAFHDSGTAEYITRKVIVEAIRAQGESAKPAPVRIIDDVEFVRMEGKLEPDEENKLFAISYTCLHGKTHTVTASSIDGLSDELIHSTCECGRK